MKKAFQRHLNGLAAVFAICEQLARRGHTPFIPSHDFGIDLMLDNGLKIQVKSSTCWRKATINAVGYQFDLRGSVRWINGKAESHSSDASRYVEICDFFILMAVDERRFFVVPTSKLGGTCIWFPKRDDHGTRRPYRKDRWLLEYEEAWDLLDVNQTIESLEEATQISNAQSSKELSWQER